MGCGRLASPRKPRRSPSVEESPSLFLWQTPWSWRGLGRTFESVIDSACFTPSRIRNGFASSTAWRASSIGAGSTLCWPFATKSQRIEAGLSVSPKWRSEPRFGKVGPWNPSRRRNLRATSIERGVFRGSPPSPASEVPRVTPMAPPSFAPTRGEIWQPTFDWFV